MLTRMPWEMRREEFPFMTHLTPLTRPKDHPHPLPPLVEGMWAVDTTWGLHHLRRVSLDQIYPSESLSEKNSEWVDRYVLWAQRGSPLPPVILVETRHQNLCLTNGHHRYLAARVLGQTWLWAWVSLTHYYLLSNRATWGQDFNYDKAVLLAWQSGIRVRPDILHDLFTHDEQDLLLQLPNVSINKYDERYFNSGLSLQTRDLITPAGSGRHWQLLPYGEKAVALLQSLEGAAV